MDVSYLDVDPKVDAKSLTLEHYNDRDYGYVRVEATPEHLAIGYYSVGAIDSARSPPDKVTVALKTRKIVGNR